MLRDFSQIPRYTFRRLKDRGGAMTVVCAWCRKEMGQKPPLEDLRTTHTLCPLCESLVCLSPLGSALQPRREG